MEIFDNFLDKPVFDSIKNCISDSSFPWFWSEAVCFDSNSEKNTICDDLDNFLLAHIVYINKSPNSQYYSSFIPIFDKLNIRSLLRVKVNCYPKTSKIVEHGYHVDYPYNDSKTAILYLNTCNGYTKFKNSIGKVDSKENRIVIFNSNTSHCGSTCTDSTRRMVININYF